MNRNGYIDTWTPICIRVCLFLFFFALCVCVTQETKRKSHLFHLNGDKSNGFRG